MKRLLALLLCLAMCVSLIPAAAAEDIEIVEPDGAAETEEDDIAVVDPTVPEEEPAEPDKTEPGPDAEPLASPPVLETVLVESAIPTVQRPDDEIPEGYTAITDAIDLWTIRSDMAGHYILTADIDLESALAPDGDLYSACGWTALGYNTDSDIEAFTGVLDGNGHTVYGMRCLSAAAALIAANRGVIKNLTLTGSIEATAPAAGGFVLDNYGTIENCHNQVNVSITFKGDRYAPFAGGIAAKNHAEGTILFCSNHASIIGEINCFWRNVVAAGGIAGSNEGKIDRVWNTGSISYAANTYWQNGSANYVNGSYAGGIVGASYSTSSTPILTNAFNSGAVTCRNTATPEKGYNAGAYAGGITGRIDYKNSASILSCCYSTGQISASAASSYGSMYAGAIAGTVYNSTATCCYYLNNMDKGIGSLDTSSDPCVSASAALMKRQTTFSGFDFTNTWEMGTGDYLYPVLRHIHNLWHVRANEPDCTHSGNVEHWVCKTCGTCYTDEALTGTIADPVLPPQHNYVPTVTPPTCTERGYTTYVCSLCGDSYVDNYTDALGHDWGEPSYIWAADNSCVTASHVCANDPTHTETETADTTDAVTTPATCETDGVRTYTAVFTTPGFETQTKTEPIPAYGHTWNAPSYVWSADNRTVTAKAICAIDPSHRAIETVQTNVTIITPASCEIDGEGLFTAEFKNPLFETQTKTAPLPAYGHDWGEPSYTWAADNSRVTASRVCANDPTHTETETADTTDAVTTPATCETDGVRTYTAVFDSPFFETQTKSVPIPATGHTPGEPVIENEVAATCESKGSYDTVVYCTVCGKELSREHTETPALGHDWGEAIYTWAADNSAVTAEIVCANDPTHTETETADTTDAVTTPASCEADGVRTYTAVFDSPFFETQTKSVPIPATGHTPGEPVIENEVAATCESKGGYDTVVYCTACGKELSRVTTIIQAFGHDWGEPVWAWEGYEAASATFTCANDASHVETVEAIIEAERTEPSSEAAGSVVYTATAIFNGEAYSDTKTEVLPRLKPTITRQPASVTAPLNQTVSFTVEAEGAESYQWQYRKGSTGTWYSSSLTGCTSAALSVKATTARDGFQFRCKVKNAAGTTYSKAATLSILPKPTITAQPTDATGLENKTVTFTVTATGADSYQWQYRSSADGTWTNSYLSGYKTATLSVKATTARDGFQYRCKVKNASGTVYSKAAALTVVPKPTITTQPTSKTTPVDSTVTFTVKATGAESYQWQYRKGSSGTWYSSGLSGAKTATLTVKATEARSGFQFRCKVKNAAGTTYSKAATLTVVVKPMITTQPSSLTKTEGETAKFMVKAVCATTYQWYYRKDGSSSWAKTTLPGATTATLSVKATAARSGYQYRCKVSNDKGYMFSNIVTLTVQAANTAV